MSIQNAIALIEGQRSIIVVQYFLVLFPGSWVLLQLSIFFDKPFYRFF
jgi:hypothetical protein